MCVRGAAAQGGRTPLDAALAAQQYGLLDAMADNGVAFDVLLNKTNKARATPNTQERSLPCASFPFCNARPRKSSCLLLPRFLACARRHAGGGRLLPSVCRAESSPIMQDGITPLHKAAISNDAAALMFLLTLGASTEVTDAVRLASSRRASVRGSCSRAGVHAQVGAHKS